MAGLEALAAECKGEPTLIAADLTDNAGITQVVTEVREYPAPLDMLINNAGLQLQLDLSKIESAAGFEQEVRLNLLAPMQLNTGLLPCVRQPGGVIANVTSLLALHPKAMARSMVLGLQSEAQLVAPGPSRMLLLLNRFFPTLVAKLMMRE